MNVDMPTIKTALGEAHKERLERTDGMEDPKSVGIGEGLSATSCPGVIKEDSAELGLLKISAGLDLAAIFSSSASFSAHLQSSLNLCRTRLLFFHAAH